MSDSKIEVLDSNSGIRILDVVVPNRDVAEYISKFPPEQKEQAVVHALEVGVLCLERARSGHDLDFVRRAIEGLLNDVERALKKIPDETQNQLTAKIGMGDGQVLAPIRLLVGEVSKAASDKIQDIRILLQEHIDPTKETSTVGKALHALRDLLDPKRSDSIQGSLDAAVKQVTADSGPLATTVKNVVAQTLKPLEEKVTDLAKEVRGEAAASEALEQTTRKGTMYEEDVVHVLQKWAQWVGVEVHHVGTHNQLGDVLLVVPDSNPNGPTLRIVVEARDRQQPQGRKAIQDTLSNAMAQRSAGAAIYVSKTREGLAKEIGDWAEGVAAQGRWVACTHEHLVTAARFLVVQERIKATRAAALAIDAASIEDQIQRIRTTVRRIQDINTKATALRNGVDAIQRVAEELRNEILDALKCIEDALRCSKHEPAAGLTLEFGTGML